jgi:hypothetical protein
MRLLEVVSLARPEYDVGHGGRLGGNAGEILVREGRCRDYLAVFPPRVRRLGWRRQGRSDLPRPEYDFWAPADECFLFEIFPLAFRHSFD